LHELVHAASGYGPHEPIDSEDDAWGQVVTDLSWWGTLPADELIGGVCVHDLVDVEIPLG